MDFHTVRTAGTGMEVLGTILGAIGQMSEKHVAIHAKLCDRVVLFVCCSTQMGSPWERMPPYVAEEVMEQLKWERGASVIFRKICKGWRDAHDQSVSRLSVTSDSLPSSFKMRTRFQRVKEIEARLLFVGFF